MNLQYLNQVAKHIGSEKVSYEEMMGIMLVNSVNES